VSVKTRTGFFRNTAAEWIHTVLDEKPDALILHGRTMQEMSRCAAHWDVIGEVAELVRGKTNGDTVLIGNGDVQSYQDAMEKVKRHGVDGVMIGRAMFGAPWIFQDLPDAQEVELETKINMLMDHTALFAELMFEPGHRPLSVLKRMFKSYVVGVPKAKTLRISLDAASTPSEILDVCTAFLEETAREIGNTTPVHSAILTKGTLSNTHTEHGRDAAAGRC
jgi:tRNA-dihydrouridine synthase